MLDIAFMLLGAAIATAVGMGVIILGFQWLTGFPFRWGWRRHAAPIGKLLPQPDAAEARTASSLGERRPRIVKDDLASLLPPPSFETPRVPRGSSG